MPTPSHLLLRILRYKPSIGEPFEGGELEVGELRQATLDNIRACSRGPPTSCTVAVTVWKREQVVVAHTWNCRASP